MSHLPHWLDSLSNPRQRYWLTGEKKIFKISFKIKKVVSLFAPTHLRVLRRNFGHLLQVPEQVQVLKIFYTKREFYLPQNKSKTNVIASKIRELQPNN